MSSWNREKLDSAKNTDAQLVAKSTDLRPSSRNTRANVCAIVGCAARGSRFETSRANAATRDVASTFDAISSSYRRSRYSSRSSKRARGGFGARTFAAPANRASISPKLASSSASRASRADSRAASAAISSAISFRNAATRRSYAELFELFEEEDRPTLRGGGF